MKYLGKQDQDGFVLVLGLLLLVILAVMGSLATRTAVIELQIAGNDKNYQGNFLQSDSGTQITIELIENNFACPKGFQTATIVSGLDEYKIDILEPSLTYIEAPLEIETDEGTGKDNDPGDIRWPSGLDFTADGTVNATRVNLASSIKKMPGAAIQMGAGYEGKGKGAASGGAYYDFAMQSDRKGPRQGITSIQLNYRHLLGTEMAEKEMAASLNCN